MATPPHFAASGPFRSKRGNIFPRMSMDGHNCTGNIIRKLVGPALAEKQGHGLAVLIGEEGDGVASYTSPMLVRGSSSLLSFSSFAEATQLRKVLLANI